MRLRALSLYNFGPYKGEQKLTFPTEPGRPVLVVFGANERGKTSILNAMRWVLYGKALDRSASEIDLAKLVNRKAAEAGDWEIRATLEFEADGQVYELRRIGKPREMVLTPKSARDFDVRVYLKRDGNALPGDEVKQEINRFIPEQISRFYLFDGELLQEYEALLREGSELGRRIRSAIEQILGVPTLINGRDDLSSLYKEARKVLARESKHVEALDSLVAQHNQLDEEVRQQEEDLEKLRERRNEYTARVQEISDELGGTETVREIEAELKSKERERTRLREQEETLRAERLTALGEAWKDLLQPRLQIRRDALSEEMGKAQDQIKQRGALASQIDMIQRLLDEGVCSVCEGDVSPERQRELGERLGALRVELRELEDASSRITTIGADLKALHRLSGTGQLDRAARGEAEIRKTAFRQEQIVGEVEQLKEQLRGHNMGRIAALQRERDDMQKLLGKTEWEINRITEEVEKKQTKLREVTKLMSKNPRARRQQSGRVVEVYDALQQVFEESIDRLRDRLRDEVAERATEAFQALTTATTYRVLRINNSYGLTIEDRHGQDVPLRSAGAEQVVALSLLSALNKTAARPGPVVIDTPFGRLDPGHRENILRYVPEMAEQIVFLVHAGEVDPETGLDVIADHVGGTYEIEQVEEYYHQLKRRN